MICRSLLVYVADRPCSVRGDRPNRLECRSLLRKTNAVSNIDVWGMGSFPCDCYGIYLLKVGDVEARSCGGVGVRCIM